MFNNDINLTHNLINLILRRFDRFSDFLKILATVKLNYADVCEDFIENLLKNCIYGSQAANRIDRTLISNIISQVVHKKDFHSYESTKAAELFNTKYESQVAPL